MITLETFYQSKQWVKLTQQIKLSRLNEDGELICEHCGKPITARYDAICHHKTYLDDNNVNDAAIALDPENIAVVHHACHNRIHEKFGAIRREVYLVYGPPCSGKSTFVSQCMDHKSDLLVDIDRIRQTISNAPAHGLVPALNPVVFGIRDYLFDCIKVKRGYWKNAYIVGGFPLISERERICARLGAREIYIDTPRQECIRRLRESPEGRDVTEWEKFIDQWFERYTPRCD